MNNQLQPGLSFGKGAGGPKMKSDPIAARSAIVQAVIVALFCFLGLKNPEMVFFFWVLAVALTLANIFYTASKLAKGTAETLGLLITVGVAALTESLVVGFVMIAFLIGRL